MATVAEVLAKKGGRVHCISPSATVLEATQLMNRHTIGSLVVTVENRVVGMFTERDVLRRIVAEERLPSETRVEEVMTTDVLCARPETTLDEAAGVMKNRRVRHLPVCDGQSRLLGLISMGDLNARNATEQETTIVFLHEYIHGRV